MKESAQLEKEQSPRLVFRDGFPWGVSLSDNEMPASQIKCLNLGFVVALIVEEKGDKEVFFFQGVGWQFLGMATDSQIGHSKLSTESEIRNYHFLSEGKLSSPPPQADKKAMLFVGSKRVGDFLAQVNWLSNYLDKYGVDQLKANIDSIAYSPQLCFLELHDLFPDISGLFVETTDDYLTVGERSGHSKIFVLNEMMDGRRANYGPLARRFEESFGVSAAPMRSIRLVVSFDLEKRIWVNQNECIEAIIGYVKKKYESPVSVIVNGMTGNTSQLRHEISAVVKSEKNIVNKLSAMENVEVVDCSEQTLGDKYKNFLGAHFFIAPIGSATMLPSLIMGINGMAVGNSEMISSPWYRAFAEKKCWFPDIEKIGTAAEARGIKEWHKPAETVSYSIDEDYFISEFANLISEAI